MGDGKAMIDACFHASEKDWLRSLSSVLHMLKYAGAEELLPMFSEIDTDNYMEKSELTRLAILATSVEYWYNRRKLYDHLPDWIISEKTNLGEPYVQESARDGILFFCTQECLNHNVIVEETFFDVL